MGRRTRAGRRSGRSRTTSLRSRRPSSGAVEEAGDTLDELEQRSLLTCERLGLGKEHVTRYRLHDLLRAVALETLARNPVQKHEALRRLAEHFFEILRSAYALYNAGHDNVGRGLALLDAELANILAARRWAAEAMAEDELAARLTQAFASYGFLRFRLSPDEHLSCLEASLSAAERRSDRTGQAIAAGNLGLIYRERGEPDRAEEMFLKSLAIEEELGRKEGMAADYGNLGLIYWDRRELDRAEEMVLKSLAINEELGHKEGMASQSSNLAVIYRKRGNLDRFEEMILKSLAIDEELGRKERTAAGYANLGSLYAQQGDMGRAVAYWRKSLGLHRDLGARPEVERIRRALRAAGVDPNVDDAAA